MAQDGDLDCKVLWSVRQRKFKGQSEIGVLVALSAVTGRELFTRPDSVDSDKRSQQMSCSKSAPRDTDTFVG